MHLQAQLDQLMFGKISTRIIHPTKLRGLLLEIQESLPDLLSLISNPKTDLWTFYRYLTSSTFFTEGKIMVILSIPLIRMDKLYDVYQATTLPVVSKFSFNIQGNNSNLDLLAAFGLEAPGFLIDKSRTTYQLLSREILRVCSYNNVKFCKVQSPVFPVSLSRTCLINMFISDQGMHNRFCTATVTNEKLPLTKHLFGISWVVVSHTRLNFAVVCNGRLQQLQTHPTRDLIKVNPGCTATNKYFTISTPFVVGRSTTVYNNTLDLTMANFSHIKDLIWKPLRDKFPNETKLQIPKTLAEINDMSLTNLISQIDSVDDIDLTTKPSFSPWFYVSLVLVLVVLIIIVLCCVYKNGKYKCLPNCLRDAQKKRQRPTVSTEIELQEMKSGGTLPPAEVSANEPPPSRERLYPHLYWKNSAN